MLAMVPEVALLFALALCVRYAADTIGRPVVDYYKLDHALLRIVALVLGIGLAFGVNVPIVDNGLAPWASKAVTGVLLGGGAGLIHDFLKAIGGVQAGRRKPTL